LWRLTKPHGACVLELEEDCDFAAETEAGQAAVAALDDLTNTPPTTLAGMRAVMEYLVELDGHSVAVQGTRTRLPQIEAIHPWRRRG
jgi:hypothetical protein